MPTSVRLDNETEVLLQRLAHRSGRTKSDVLREALHHLAAEQEKSALPNGPYALISDLLGIAQGGPKDLARRHKRAFRERLANRTRQ